MHNLLLVLIMKSVHCKPQYVLSDIAMMTQGSHCLSEICISRRQTLRILCQWNEKCVQHNLELVHKLAKPKWRSSLKWADENSKKKVYPCTKKWKCSVNLPFTKNRIDRNIVCGIIFQKMNYSRRCRQTQFSSTAGFSNKIVKIKAATILSHWYSLWMCILFSVS